MSDDTVFPSWYLITVSDKSCSASLTCNNLTSLAISRTVAIRRAAKHNLFVVLAFKGTGAIFFVWNPFQQELQWIKRNAFPRQREECHSVVCVACRDYYCLSCAVSRLFMCKCNKISIDGKLRQKKSWIKEKVQLSYSSPSTQQWFGSDIYRLNAEFWSRTYFLLHRIRRWNATLSPRKEPYDFRHYFNEEGFVIKMISAEHSSNNGKNKVTKKSS